MSQSASDSECKFKVLENDQVGRYLVANKDLEAGEEILTELPFVVGPKPSTYPICLGCYAAWPTDPSNLTLCSKCSWPVCNSECENKPQHRDYECQIFSEAKEKFDVNVLSNEEYMQNGVPQFECITPLRLLLASEKDSERWNKEVKGMEAHNKKRCEGSQWNTDHVNIVEFIRKRLKLERFSEDLIQTVCGILEINSFEVRTPSGFLVRAVYPQASLMNHSCVSNTCHSVPITEDYRIHFRTTVKVSKGAELFATYVHTLLPTLIRREFLQQSKHFSCACSRCADPTELGTHMSSLKCSKCDNGVVVALDSLDPESSWKCTHCEFSTSAAAVKKVFRIIQMEIDQIEMLSAGDGPDAIQQRENFIKKYHSVLHPQHALLATVKFSLGQLYGKVEEYLLDDLPDIVLEHKVELCELVLKILDKIEPGLSRTRGLILYELHAPLLFIAKSQWSAGVIDDSKLKSKMEDAAKVLKEAADILCLEPTGTPEAEVGQVAKQALVQLNESITNM